MEVEREEESAEINYYLYLTVTGSAIISPLVFPYSLSPLVYVCVCIYGCVCVCRPSTVSPQAPVQYIAITKSFTKQSNVTAPLCNITEYTTCSCIMSRAQSLYIIKSPLHPL